MIGIGPTFAVDGCAVIARRGPPIPLFAVPNVTINGQYTNFILFDVALPIKGLSLTLP